MSSKNKIIIFGSIIMAIFLLLIIYMFIPKITLKLNGSKKVFVEVGEDYNDLGAEAYYENIFQSKKINVETYGVVNTQKLGEYNIKYKATHKKITKEKTRVVQVVDNKKPEIVIEKEISACKKAQLIDIGAVATDNYDGIITDKIKYRVDNDDVYISVSDSSNNTTEVIKKIKFIDDEKPTITLNGSQTSYLVVGENYIELGAEAYDSCDGNITSNIEIDGKVNSEVVGTYEIKYKVKDSVNNEVVVKRIIYVVESAEEINIHPVTNKATIYLTFDDGPGVYTEEILNVLDKYNIKATFFVTNQFPKYQSFIQKEYEKGHTVGAHTYSHKWTVYESVSTYLEDFEKIQNIIIKQTGQAAKFFRFPGGSSNTISRNYSKGIMTKLAKKMTENGYIYFDWTFDSGDTSKSNNSKEAIISNVKKNLKGDGEYIILMHDIKKNTLEALPEIIKFAKTMGYSFAAIDETVTPYHLKIVN